MAFNLGGAAGGAVTGASLGSVFGPIGTGIGAVGGGLLGGLLKRKKNQTQESSQQPLFNYTGARPPEVSFLRRLILHQRKPRRQDRCGHNNILLQSLALCGGLNKFP